MESLELECDRLSHVVDHVQFERLRWSKNEGPMLARLVELIQETFAARDDFDLTDEGSTASVKRFVLKIHNQRVIGIVIALDRGRAVIAAEVIERSKFRLLDSSPVSADFNTVDAQWMAATLQELLRRVQP